MSTARGNPRTYGRTDELTNVSLPTVDILQVRYAHEQQQDSACSADSHGTAKDYNRPIRPCRCPDARDAHRLDNNVRRAEQRAGMSRLVPSWPYRRRIEALGAIGWPVDVFAVRLGVTGQHVSKATSRARMSRRTADVIAAVYEQLHMTPGPSNPVRTWARDHRWAPPLAWDDIDDPAERPKMPVAGTTALALEALVVDEVAIERAAAGDRVPLTVRERALAVALLAGRGYGDGQIAARLRITDRTAGRIRKRLDIPAVVDAGGHRVFTSRTA